MNIQKIMAHPKRARTGTHNGSPYCVHGKTTSTDNCEACIIARGWVVIDSRKVSVTP